MIPLHDVSRGEIPKWRFTRHKCHLLSNWEAAASPCLFRLLVFRCWLCALIGSHISITIRTEELNTKLLLTASTKLHSPTVAKAVGKTIFSFPVSTKTKILKVWEVNGLPTWWFNFWIIKFTRFKLLPAFGAAKIENCRKHQLYFIIENKWCPFL